MGEYIFGYGSIINDVSRAATAGCSDLQMPAEGSCRGGLLDKAIAARLSYNFGYKRSWCFRSHTGFTALGLSLHGDSHEEQPFNAQEGIFGILMPVVGTQIESFDTREIGYTRLRVPLEHIMIDMVSGCEAARGRAMAVEQQLDSGVADICVWVYVPDKDHELFADEEHPILTTYVDVVFSGCLEWGGLSLMNECISNTFCWSKYHLYDVPLSRRPWIHRTKHYKVIDSSLLDCAHVMLHVRKHPEEYSALYLTALRGVWGVPSACPVFIGRENELMNIHTGIFDEHALAVADMNVPQYPSSTIQCLQVVGQAGVGKSALVSEYCWRHYTKSNDYGLVIWLRSESAATLSEDLRKFAYDLGILRRQSLSSADDGDKPYVGKIDADGASQGLDDDHLVLREVKRRLAKCCCPWLLVFDNVEDPSVIEEYIPKGHVGLQAYGGSDEGPTSTSNALSTGQSDGHHQPTASIGHVIITSRINVPQNKLGLRYWRSVQLDCFQSNESMSFFNSYLLHIVNTEEVSCSPADPSAPLKGDNNLAVLAAKLGHLPLALSIASAYMIHCGVTCTEYIVRLDHLILHDVDADNTNGTTTKSISNSLNMTLSSIRKECTEASIVLSCLGYLYAEGISKELVKSILHRHYSCSYTKLELKKALEAKAAVDYEVPSDEKAGDLGGGKKDYQLKPLLPFTFPSSYIYIYLTSTNFFIIWLILYSLLPNESVHKLSFIALVCSVGTTISCVVLVVMGIDGGVLMGHGNHEHSTAGKGILVKQTPQIFAPYVNNSVHMISGEQLNQACDRVWDIMKQFSLLQVQSSGYHSPVTGSIHRLQQTILRADHRLISELTSLSCCIDSLHELWDYSVNHSSTWSYCSELLPHVESVWLHVYNRYMESERYPESTVPPLTLPTPVLWKLVGMVVEVCSFTSTALSQFHVAQRLLLDVLAFYRLVLASRGVNISNYTVASEVLADEAHFTNVICNVLFELGKVSRYIGDLETSFSLFTFTLNLRWGYVQDMMPSMDSSLIQVLSDTKSQSRLEEWHSRILQVTDTLHEMGVLNLRRKQLCFAARYLEISLLLKRKDVMATNPFSFPDVDAWIKTVNTDLFMLDDSAPSLSHPYYITIGIASTLHQLGVAAIASKRYVSAEQLFLSAQSYMGKDEYAARAATLQQLGRASLRRGHTSLAKDRMLESLALYRTVYGAESAMSHVNVAAVCHQLGNTYMMMHDFAASRDYFLKALDIRQSILADCIEDEAFLDVGEELLSSGTGSRDGAANDMISLDYLEILTDLQLLAESEYQLSEQERGRDVDQHAVGEQYCLLWDSVFSRFMKLRFISNRLLNIYGNTGTGGADDDDHNGLLERNLNVDGIDNDHHITVACVSSASNSESTSMMALLKICDDLLKCSTLSKKSIVASKRRNAQTVKQLQEWKRNKLVGHYLFAVRRLMYLRKCKDEMSQWRSASTQWELVDCAMLSSHLQRFKCTFCKAERHGVGHDKRMDIDVMNKGQIAVELRSVVRGLAIGCMTFAKYLQKSAVECEKPRDEFVALFEHTMFTLNEYMLGGGHSKCTLELESVDGESVSWEKGIVIFVEKVQKLLVGVDDHAVASAGSVVQLPASAMKELGGALFTVCDEYRDVLRAGGMNVSD